MTKFLSFIGWSIINLIGKTIKVKEINSFPWQENHVTYAFWHGEQFIPCYHHRNQGAVIMSSLSRDGEIQTGILKLFGYKVVRGSSTRGGEKALVEAIHLCRKGNSAAFAVDGPRGPVYEVKSGITLLAQKTGVPVIPVSTGVSRFKVLSKAWDKYELPMPVTYAVIAYGQPIKVEKNDDITKKTLEIQNSLQMLSKFTHENFWSYNVKDYLQNHPRPKILIVQPSRIGDVIFSMPVAAALRKQFPNAWIGWFVDERCAPILQGSPDIDEVIIFDRQKYSFNSVKNLYKYLHAKNIDLSIDLHGLFKSSLMVLLAGAKFRIASSSTNGMREFSWLFSKEIKAEKENAHCIERHLAATDFLGCQKAKPEYNIMVGDTENKKIESLFKEKNINLDKPVVAVHPGGGWISRRWFPERFAVLINKLSSELGAQIILVGGKEGGAGEKGLNEIIIAAAKCKVIDLTDALSLKELCALFKHCSVFVANEAGPMHIATAMNVPAVALLGPTNPDRTGPFGNNTKIIRHIVECQPCRQRSCSIRKCMDLITVDEVFKAVKEKICSLKEF